jgi:hypothetical protein
MNNQEIFDTIATHLLTQNEKSLSPNGLCVYKSPLGLSCAVGYLLKDKDTSTYEGVGVDDLRHTIRDPNQKTLYQDLLSVGVPDTDEAFNLLDELQVVHDSFQPVNWKKHLQLLAENKGLLWRF